MGQNLQTEGALRSKPGIKECTKTSSSLPQDSLGNLFRDDDDAAEMDRMRQALKRREMVTKIESDSQTKRWKDFRLGRLSVAAHNEYEMVTSTYDLERKENYIHIHTFFFLLNQIVCMYVCVFVCMYVCIRVDVCTNRYSLLCGSKLCSMGVGGAIGGSGVWHRTQV